MKCKLCNEKIRVPSYGEPSKDFCWYCELVYRSANDILIAMVAMYNQKASKRIPDNVDELIQRLIKYRKITNDQTED